MIMIYYDLTMVNGLAEYSKAVNCAYPQQYFIKPYFSQSLFQRAVEIGFRGPEDSIDDPNVYALLF